eukprot:SAG31_NODE_6555_length_1979_cov_2.582979_1_plen_173_part_00
MADRMDQPDAELDALSMDFARTGFVVLDGALSPREVAQLNVAIDIDRRHNPMRWRRAGPAVESGRFQSVDLLVTSSAFDAVCTHPSVLPVLRRLMGVGFCFEEFSAMVREPVDEPPPSGQMWHHRRWHRDGGRHDFDNSLLLFKAQAIFFLTDVVRAVTFSFVCNYSRNTGL